MPSRCRPLAGRTGRVGTWRGRAPLCPPAWAWGAAARHWRWRQSALMHPASPAGPVGSIARLLMTNAGSRSRSWL